MQIIIFVECRPVGGQRGVHRDPNAIAAQRAVRFFQTHAIRWGGKHVKVKKRRRQDIVRFRNDARKLILGSIGTPLDHLSVKTPFSANLGNFQFQRLKFCKISVPKPQIGSKFSSSSPYFFQKKKKKKFFKPLFLCLTVL